MRISDWSSDVCSSDLHLLDEQGISRELEALRTVRLKAKGFPDAMDGRRRVVDGFSHRPQAPMRRASRRRLQGQPDRLGDLVIADLARPARPRLVVDRKSTRLNSSH